MKNAFITSLRGYNGEKFIKDLMSGIMVAIIALPLSIALGIQSGVTLQQGILTAIVAGFFISALGGSRYQIGGPTAAFVAIIVGYLSNPDIGFIGLQMATILAGIILLLMGTFKLGKLIKFVPYPIVIGFTTGIGITLLIGQLKDFMGLNVAINGDFWHKLYLIGSNIGNINFASLTIGILTLLVIVLVGKHFKKLPAQFIGILFATLLVVGLSQLNPNLNIATIGSTFGDIKAEIHFIDFTALTGVKFSAIILPAFVIAFLCAIESLLSATVADGITNTTHDSNMELIGQGVANIAAPLVGGLPATGAIARTAANIKNGAVSPVSGIIHSVALLIMFIALMPVVKFIPMTALASVLIMVSIGMANFKLFARLACQNWRDSIVLITTCALTVAFDLVVGVASGMILTFVFTLPTYKNSLKHSKGELENTLSLQGSLHFINVSQLISSIEHLWSNDDQKNIKIDLSACKYIDISALEKLYRFTHKYNDKYSLVFSDKHGKMFANMFNEKSRH